MLCDRCQLGFLSLLNAEVIETCTMIGSLIYYALYPLTKLIDRLAASWWKGGPARPVFINGKEVWDGAGAPCRRLSEQQTALLDQWLSAGSKPWEKPKPADEERGDSEGLVETRLLLVGEAVTGENREQEKGLIAKESNQDAEEMSMMSTELALEKVGGAFASNMEKDNDDLHEEKKEGTIPSGTDGMNIRLTEKEEVASMIELERRSTVAWAESQAPAALGSKDEFRSQEEKKGNEETGTVRAVVQPGDQNINSVESEAQVSCILNLSMLLEDSHAESLNSFTNFKSEPAGWHFPVSLGLSETVYCPMQFPGMSYYPTLQNNFEVMWRIWEDLSENSVHATAPPTACSDPRSRFTFTVMSYNILAQDLLEAGIANLYVHCSEEVLAWDKRFHAILKELQTWEPDIVCLQEVQENHFLEKMQAALIEMGYICVYKRRTGTKTDGCAVCYNASRFTQLSVSLLEFRRQDCELLDRDNVGIVLLLQPIGEHGEDLRPVCVANTHLLFNPRRGDVKLAQLAIVLAEIDSVVKQCRARGSDCEIILCGDFNSLPNMPLYQLIVNGQLYYHGLPAWMVSGQEDLSYKIHYRRLYTPLWPSSLGINDNCQYSSVCKPLTQSSGKLQYSHDFLRQLRYCQAACVRPPDLELIPGLTDITPTPNPEDTHLLASRFRNTIFHGFKLSSVYNPFITGTDHCAVTTLHSEGAAMVDYIFYSTGRDCTRDLRDGENGLKLLGRLLLLAEADLWSMNGLPNEMFPSDHLSLLARFQLG